MCPAGSQDHQGDLATLVEEGATGIRVIKSFGRCRWCAPVPAQPRVLHDSSMDRVRILIHFSGSSTCPGITLAAVLFGGALAVGKAR